MNLSNNAQRVLEYVAQKGYQADAQAIYNALRMDKTILLCAICKLLQNGVNVALTSNNQDILTVYIKQTRQIRSYLKS